MSAKEDSRKWTLSNGDTLSAEFDGQELVIRVSGTIRDGAGTTKEAPVFQKRITERELMGVVREEKERKDDRVAIVRDGRIMSECMGLDD